jgi:acetylornithine aminotransferase
VIWYGGHERLIDVVRAEGLFVYDKDSKAYMDLESGVWCSPLGHGDEAVKLAMKSQLDECSHTGYSYSCAVVEKSAEKLLETVSLDGGKCIFLSSGSEAVESGAQTIKKISGKKYLMTMSDSFLGSHGSVCEMRDGEWFLFDWAECVDCDDKNCADCQLFRNIPFEEIGGFIFEPGSSAGLVRFPPEKLISEIASHLKAHGGYFMSNEVTTGVGRTGKLYGYEHYNVNSDIVAIGKGIGNGYPVSAVLVSGLVYKAIEDSTFGISQSHQNDPLGAAIALAVINEIECRKLVECSAVNGAYLLQKLESLRKAHGCISEVRGRGLMVSITFESVTENDLKDVFLKLLDAGYIIVKRPNLNVFRIDPPLIIEKAHIDSFIDDFSQILGQIK